MGVDERGRPPLIYLAGPYTTGDPVLNTRKAMAFGLHLYEYTGCPVLVPHLTMLAHLMFPRPLSYWYAFDKRQIEHCDAVWRLPGESDGADMEVAYAEKIGLPVFHDPSDVRRWISGTYGPEPFEVPR
jgi:hypothetical protein